MLAAFSGIASARAQPHGIVLALHDNELPLPPFAANEIGRAGFRAGQFTALQKDAPKQVAHRARRFLLNKFEKF